MPYGKLDFTHLSSQATFIHRAQLIEQNTRGFTRKHDLRATTQRLSLTGQRRYDDTRQRNIQVIRRNHQSRACFFDFRADGRIKVDPIHFTALYHTQSSLPSATGKVIRLGRSPIAPQIEIMRSPDISAKLLIGAGPVLSVAQVHDQGICAEFMRPRMISVLRARPPELRCLS